MIKVEMERFEKYRIYDFKTTFIKYLENHMAHQTQVRKKNLVDNPFLIFFFF